MIECILLSVFDDILGPKIIYQTPKGFLDTDFFQRIAHYVITKPELSEKLLSFNVLDYRIIGCPVAILDPSYARNVFFFNCAFVLSIPKHESTNLEPSFEEYELVVKKLASYLKIIELETQLLSNTENEVVLRYLLDSIREQLNRKGSVSIPVDTATTIHLTLQPPLPLAPAVAPHDCPIVIRPLPASFPPGYLLTHQQILPFVDGVRSLHQISQESGVDLSLAQTAIQTLISQGYLSVIDVFHFENRYRLASPLQLLQNKELQKAAMAYVSVDNDIKINCADIVRFYASIDSCLGIGQWALKNEFSAKNIDVRRFVVFGVLAGIIARAHRYPLLSSPSHSQPHAALASPTGLTHEVYNLLDGMHSLDEICSVLCMNAADAEALLHSSGCSFIYR